MFADEVQSSQSSREIKSCLMIGSCWRWPIFLLALVTMASLPSKSAGDSADVDTSAVSHHSSTTDATQNTSEGIENAPESENRGLKRKAREALVARGARVEDQERCMFLELPDDILAISLSFQAHKDRLVVSITCKDSLKKVETFSERKWKEIQLKADDTWETRLRDQLSINTENPKPLVLPHRYLLWKACRTYLYALGEPNTSKIVDMEVLSDRRLAIFAGVYLDRRVCQKWDLTTKQCVTSFNFFPGQQEQEEIYNVLVRREHIIAQALDSVLVWTRDGELLHRVAEPESSIEATAADEQKEFFGNESNSISCLDIATGAVRRGVVTWQSRFQKLSILVSENLLVVAHGMEVDKNDIPVPEEDPNSVGIYVFDIKGGYSQKHFSPGDYYNIIKASDDPSTIVASREGHIDVFKLENGQISRTKTFSNLLTRRTSDSNNNRILRAARSRIYMRNTDAGRVEEYNGLSGELLRTFGDISSDAICTTATPSGCELFLGYYDFDPNGDGSPSVRAYRLDGP